jgi:hypothetical protein
MTGIQDSGGISFRVPSAYGRCRRPRCHQPPVADMWRGHGAPGPDKRGSWYAYCVEHLRDYNREVRDGRIRFLPRREVVP